MNRRAATALGFIPLVGLTIGVIPAAHANDGALRSGLGRSDLGRSDLGRGDLGRGDLGRGDLGRRAAVVEPLVLVAQDFTLPPNDVFDLTLGLPAGFDSTVLGQDGVPAEVEIGVYRDVSTRDEVRAAASGDLDRIGDTFTLSLDAADADPRVGRPAPDQLTLAVPTEMEQTADALTVALPGIYPVVIDLRVDDEIVAEVITFIHRAADDAALQAELSVGLLAGQTVEPTIGIDGNVVPSADELAELADLADLLAALEGVPATLGINVSMPRAVVVEASTLGALQNVDPDLASRLIPLLERSELVATTKLPLDPSTAMRNTQQDLYTRWLVEGEDTLVTVAPGAQVDRTMHVITAPTSTDAALMLRGLGTRTLVLSPDIYLVEDNGNIGGYTDTSRLVNVDLGGGDTIPAAVIDPYFADMLDHPSDDPLGAAIVMAAELLALNEQLVSSGEDVSRHGMVIATADAGVPEPAVIANLARLLLGTNGVDVVAPSTIGAITINQMYDGHELAIEFPSDVGDDMSARLEAIDEISIEYLGVASMLPADDPTLTEWATVVEALPSTALTDEDVDDMVESLRVSFDVYRLGVVGPDPFSFTITGRDSSIPISITNLTATPLTVKIRLSSAKLTFPQGDIVQVLPPNETTDLRVDVEARSNGKAGVNLEILMPATDQQIVPAVVLTARVSALTGLAQLITGAALLVLATWWLRHWRMARRRKIAADHHHRHPAGNGVTNGRASSETAAGADGDGEELAPDAAASSLPPS